MNDVIAKVNDLYEIVAKKNEELTKLINISKENHARLEDIEKRQQAREVQLGERELKIGKMENVVFMKKEAERLLREAQELTEAMRKEKADFVAWTEKERADIAQCKRGVEKGVEEVKEREKLLEEEKKKLAQDKLTYREHIIREIGKMTNAANS